MRTRKQFCCATLSCMSPCIVMHCGIVMHHNGTTTVQGAAYRHQKWSHQNTLSRRQTRPQVLEYWNIQENSTKNCLFRYRREGGRVPAFFSHLRSSSPLRVLPGLWTGPVNIVGQTGTGGAGDARASCTGYSRFAVTGYNYTISSIMCLSGRLPVLMRSECAYQHSQLAEPQVPWTVVFLA